MDVKDAVRQGPVAYPATAADEVVETLHGVAVADPYRWLEGDVRSDERVQDWVAAQNAVTESYLETLEGRDGLRMRLAELWNYSRVGLPVRRGTRYFHLFNPGLAAQPVLQVREGAEGEPRTLLDPTTWSEDGATALAEWEPSADGTKVAYAVQEGGTDWRIVRVLDLASGGDTGDAVAWVKFSGLSWAKNGSGFFYSRFPEPPAGAEYQAANHDHAVYFHRLGTPQAADRMVFATPDRPRLSHHAEVSADGQWLLVTSAEGTEARHDLTIIDLTAPKIRPRTLIRGLEHEWRLIGTDGDIFYFITNSEAPRCRVVAMDVRSDMRRHREVVPHGPDVLVDGRLVGGWLVLSYLHDVAAVMRVFDTKGRAKSDVTLPGLGSVLGLSGREDGSEALYAFASYDRPTEIHRLDAATLDQSLFAAPTLTFDPDRFLVERSTARAADDTLIPVFVLRRKDRDGPLPTLLYGYGGFAISLTPGFDAAALAWAEAGGAYAVANVRGGGEYGKPWHDAGRRSAKQTVFDDFIAAAEHLVASGTAKAGGVAILGYSNGGLLVAAVTNQRPDLFAAALPAVGVHDMLRFHRWTAGRYWIDDYGDPGVEADFEVLRAYSPLHNIPARGRYPAILVSTADTDDRVVPAHSFKYTAALQAADLGEKPRLIRIETRAGHGAGKPMSRHIEEMADLLAFAAHWTGLALD